MRQRSFFSLMFAPCAVLSSACGDPLADVAYQGEARFRYKGRLSGRIGNGALVNPAVGVVWLGASGFLVGNVAGLTPVTNTSFPLDFNAALFDQPPEGTRPWLNADFFQMVSGIPVVRGLRLGVIVAIDDVDKDGRVSLSDEGSAIVGGDRFFGIATARVVGYVDAGYESVAYKGLTLEPGFHLLDPCYGTPKTYSNGDLIEVELFPPSRYLSLGARGTSVCPVVLMPQSRGPLQQALIESPQCTALCGRFRGTSCSVSCGSEMCLRLVQESRCVEAKVQRLNCLSQTVTLSCPKSGSPDIDEGDCPYFNELCAADTDAQALSQTPECLMFCERHRRATGAGACQEDCTTQTCARITFKQPCLAAKQAQLSCRSQYADNSECIDFFSQFGGLCLATAQFDHLCPSVY